MTKFTPFSDKIVIKPFESDSPFGENKLQEVGQVTAIGSKVKFVKVGDTVYFNAEGVRKTQQIDGQELYVISEEPEFILGKISDETKKKSSVAK